MREATVKTASSGKLQQSIDIGPHHLIADEVKEHGKEGGLVWVLGRLTIKDGKGNPKSL